MAYFLEYLVPAEHDGAEVPVDAPTPDGGTAERVIHLDALPARSRISADSLGDARAEAEQLLAHSKAESGELFEDPDDSLEAGSGRRSGSFREGEGWTED